MLRTLLRRGHTHDEPLSIRELVFGYNDGLVTTFTVVVGFTGAALSNRVIIIAALINAISDGLSMAVGSWLSAKSEREQYEAAMLDESENIGLDPDFERSALKAHLSGLGVQGRTLDSAVKQIEADETIWARTMARDVRGLEPSEQNPVLGGVAMFFAFLLGSLFPIVPFLVGMPNPFLASVITSLASAFAVGAVKTAVTRKNWVVSGMETLVIAALLMTVAYGLGVVISGLVG